MIGSTKGPRMRTMTDLVTIGLLLLGGFAFLIGWVVGVVLLWRSRTWPTWEKVLGTLIVPGGLSLPVLIALFVPAGYTCSGHGGSSMPAVVTCEGGVPVGAGISLIMVLTLAQLVASGVLLLAARGEGMRGPASTPAPGGASPA
jgi:hypothetical protein